MLQKRIQECKVLVVGAGGIGCEVLKNLTLSGFKNIDAIDLDTIDVSNLNRQFLFNKSNVGQSKAKVAIDIVKKDYSASPEGLNLNAFHKSVMLSEFDIDFYRQYSLVINALDNRAARSHVNRMCLAAEVPLLESGTAGYKGQSKLIKNSLTACYECDGIPKEGKTYATCTIRNTPSQPIHCIVWAKHLFHQLFGEKDPDNDVSPDLDQYDPVLLIKKLYQDDIEYLLSMENLWRERAKPTPLHYSNLMQNGVEEPHCSKSLTNGNSHKLSNQRLWSIKECAEIFMDTVSKLHSRLKTHGYQTWDKDDEIALNFVVAASNLRSKCFNIERKSPFDVKSMAGNIVPAISSTNSIIGGMLVLQAMRLLKKMPVGEEYRKLEDSERNALIKGTGCWTFLNSTSQGRKGLIESFECPPPQPTCLACSRENTPEIEIHLSMEESTLSDLVDKIVIGTFQFVCPDLTLDDDSGLIIWSKDEDDEDGGQDQTKLKKLVELPHVKLPKTRLLINDLLQDKQLKLVLIDDKIDEEKTQNFFYAKMGGKELNV